MAIRFGGDFSVARSRQEVFDFLTDPNKFAPLLPEFQSLAVEDAQNFTVKVNVGVSYIRGAADVKMKLAEAARPERARYEGTGNVAGGSVKMTAGFDLEETNPGTRVRWSGEAQIYGRLASMAGGMLEPLARKNVQKLINGLESALGKA